MSAGWQGRGEWRGRFAYPLQAIAPMHEEIHKRYDSSKERLRVQDYSLDKRMFLEQRGL